jgi:transketolase
MENKAPWHHKVPNTEEYEQIERDLTKRKEAIEHA